MSKWLLLPTKPPTRYRDDTLLMPGLVPDALQAVLNDELRKINLKIVKVLTADGVGPGLQRLELQSTAGKSVDAWPALRQLRNTAALHPLGALNPAAVIRMSLEYETDNGEAPAASSPTGEWVAASTGEAVFFADGGAVTTGGAYSPSGPPKT